MGLIQESALGNYRIAMWGRKDARGYHSRVHNQEVVSRALYLIVSLATCPQHGRPFPVWADIMQRFSDAVAAAIHAVVECDRPPDRGVHRRSKRKGAHGSFLSADRGVIEPTRCASHVSSRVRAGLSSPRIRWSRTPTTGPMNPRR
jgi:hypothetical protein